MRGRKKGAGGGISEPSRARSSEVAKVRKGRPTKCTPELIERLAQLITIGVPASVACRTESIGKVTLHDWRKQAGAGVEPYATLMARIDAAQSKAVASITMHIVKAAQRDWHAGAWWLERRAPALYGTKQTVRLEKAPVDMSEEELDAAIAKHGYVRADNKPEGTE